MQLGVNLVVGYYVGVGEKERRRVGERVREGAEGAVRAIGAMGKGGEWGEKEEYTRKRRKKEWPLFFLLFISHNSQNRCLPFATPKRRFPFPFFPPNVESHFFQLVITDENHQRIRRHPTRKITNGKVKKNSIEKKTEILRLPSTRLDLTWLANICQTIWRPNGHEPVGNQRNTTDIGTHKKRRANWKSWK